MTKPTQGQIAWYIENYDKDAEAPDVLVGQAFVVLGQVPANTMPEDVELPAYLQSNPGRIYVAGYLELAKAMHEHGVTRYASDRRISSAAANTRQLPLDIIS